MLQMGGSGRANQMKAVQLMGLPFQSWHSHTFDEFNEFS